tara:strand:- start:884 stop:1231 length:348 start_codon:yes stop_codon:yes gene_type:complete
MSEGQLQDYSVDQAAGAIVLVLGAVASLLLVIWQSKCHCKMNLCYLFQCERRPPSEEEMKGLKDQSEKLKAKAKKSKEDSSAKQEKKKKKPDEEEGFASAEEPEPQPEPLVPQAV